MPQAKLGNYPVDKASSGMAQAPSERDDPLGMWKGGSTQTAMDASGRLRGVWTPDGMNPAAILAGAAILKDQFEIGEYTARSIAKSVWKAMVSATTKSSQS